ncbi:MAG: hypothetical protein JSS14_19120 [Proteobacteria bacterium]|nr:hypothetical protein [Pseudomonadota bacterium]
MALTTYGNTAPDAELVVLYGNCQVPFLARALAMADGGASGRGYLCVLNHAPPGHDIEMPRREDLARCKLYLEQYDSEIFIRVREELRDGITRQCPTLVFPTYMANFMWPFQMPEPQPTGDARWPFGRYPEGDQIGHWLRDKALQGAAALDAYMAQSSLQMPDLDARLAIDIGHMQRRDSRSDVHLQDFVLANFRDQHMFWTFGHVNDQAVAELACRVYAQAAFDLGSHHADMPSRIRAAAAALGGMGPHQCPIHPRVAEHFGLRFWQPDMRFQWFDRHWTFADYMPRYITRDTNW